MDRNKFFKSLIQLFILLQFLSPNLFAAAETGSNSATSIMLVLTILMIVFVIWLILVYSERNDNSGELFLTPLLEFKKYLMRATPIEDEAKVLLAHDYDGIRELDNRVPPWFNFLFYGTILFAVIYMVNYHIIGSGDVQSQEYTQEVNTANLEIEILIRTGAFLNEETVTLLSDAATLSEGKDIFIKDCATCHGQNGGGIVGPNLTDDYWINGGGIKNIFKTIKYGVPQKGMISWESQLDPKKMQAAASFIISLHGTNPPNGKAPEGLKYEEPETPGS
ncbi:MAG: cbb3-type cytochrome c oxidase N-terminal domain-containing protein [bacterium]